MAIVWGLGEGRVTFDMMCVDARLLAGNLTVVSAVGIYRKPGRAIYALMSEGGVN